MRIGMRIAARLTMVIGTLIGVDRHPTADLNIIGWNGQSNEVGFADIDNVNNINQYLGNQYNAVMLRQRDFTNANPPVFTEYATEGVKPRTNSATLNMGAHLTCARYLNRRTPGRWGFSAMGGGSTGLADHWLNPAYPVGGPSLFNQAITWHRDSERLLGGALKGYVWIQGEQDATDATDAAAYQTNLTTFIANVRLTWPGLPFIIVKLHNSNPGSQKAVIRAAQVAVAGAVAGVTLLDVDALVLQGDNLHFTAESYLTLGNMIGAAINTALGISNLLPAMVTTYKGRTIDVTDASTSDGGSVTAWDWDWGDGTAHDTTQNATHTYAEDTPRTITLTATSSIGGAQRSTSKLIRPVLRTWTVDATSQKAVPATNAERAALCTAQGLSFGALAHLWLLQDLLNQTDVIAAKTLTAAGAPGTQQAVAGWSRLAVGHSGLATNQTFNNTTLLNRNANSGLGQLIGKFTSSAAIRQLFFDGATDGNAMTSSAASQKGRFRNGASVGTSTLDWANVVMPFCPLYRRAGALAADHVLITPIEIIRIPFIALTGAEIRLTVGASADATADLQALHLAHMEGSSVDTVTVQNVLDLLEAHGWPITVPGFPDL